MRWTRADPPRSASTIENRRVGEDAEGAGCYNPVSGAENLLQMMLSLTLSIIMPQGMDYPRAYLHVYSRIRPGSRVLLQHNRDTRTGPQNLGRRQAGRPGRNLREVVYCCSSCCEGRHVHECPSRLSNFLFLHILTSSSGLFHRPSFSRRRDLEVQPLETP